MKITGENMKLYINGDLVTYAVECTIEYPDYIIGQKLSAEFYAQGKVITCTGNITSFDDESIYLNEVRFPRDLCNFFLPK